MASPRKSERLISSRGHGCFTISPPQLPATATRFPSHGSGRPGLVLRTATKLSSVGFEPTAVLTFGLRVRRLNHSATRSLMSPVFEVKPTLFLDCAGRISAVFCLNDWCICCNDFASQSLNFIVILWALS